LTPTAFLGSAVICEEFKLALAVVEVAVEQAWMELFEDVSLEFEAEVVFL
jgi:hypothetical protein